MPIITPQDRVSTVSTVQPTKATHIPVIGLEPSDTPKEGSQNASNIVQDGLQSTLEAKVDQSQQDKPKEEPKSDLDARMADLSRKERQLRATAKKLAEEKAVLEANKAQTAPKEYNVKQELQKALESGQLTYEEIGQMYLNQGDPKDQAIRQLQTKIEELEKGQKQVLDSAQKAQQDAYNQALQQIDREAKALVSKSDAYEVTKVRGAESAITKLIELTYNEEGVLMDVEEAAEQVEKYLTDELLQWSQIKKIQTKTRPQEEVPPQGTPAPKQASTQLQKQSTLTRSLSQESSRPLSANDRRERAIAAFYGRLK